MPVLIISSPRFAHHIPPPGHPERPERAHVFDVVAARWLQKGGRVAEPRLATSDELLRVHAAEYVDAIERTAGQAVLLDPDTFTSSDSETIARLAAGASIQAVEHALDESEPAVALVRPPGHHAERDRAMGFCLYNNAAISAAAALARGLDRIAIVDIDVHHGNGTQAIFFEEPRVLYVSTHQYPFYPGTGAVDEVGNAAGRGFTVNIPLEAGATDSDYSVVFDNIIAPILTQFDAQLIIVSAGFDAHERDPLASMRMTAEGYGVLIDKLRHLATRDGNLVVVTEGGYDLPALAASLEESIIALSGAAHATLRDEKSPRGERALSAAYKVQRAFWSAL